MITVKHLQTYLERLVAINPRVEDSVLRIPVEVPHVTVGSRPSCIVQSICLGIDWDSSSFFMVPGKPLTYSTENIADIRKLNDQIGALKFENHKLKSELLKYKKEIDNEK